MSDLVTTQFEVESRGGVQGFVSQEILKNLEAIKISPADQKTIANYLETNTKKIDTLMEKIQIQISLLQEYRTALISKVVSGKIDVRDFKIQKSLKQKVEVIE